MLGTNMFSIYLDSVPGSNSKSHIWFGGVYLQFLRNNIPGYAYLKNQQIANKVAYMPITSTYYWQVELTSV